MENFIYLFYSIWYYEVHVCSQAFEEVNLVRLPIDTNFKCGQAPYTTDLECINEISINPNGDVVACSFPIGNIYTKGILEILAEYNPHNNPYTNALLNGGINGLIEYSKTEGRIIDISKYYSPCEICRDIAKGLT